MSSTPPTSLTWTVVLQERLLSITVTVHGLPIRLPVFPVETADRLAEINRMALAALGVKGLGGSSRDQATTSREQLGLLLGLWEADYVRGITDSRRLDKASIQIDQQGVHLTCRPLHWRALCLALIRATSQPVRTCDADGDWATSLPFTSATLTDAWVLRDATTYLDYLAACEGSSPAVLRLVSALTAPENPPRLEEPLLIFGQQAVEVESLVRAWREHRPPVMATLQCWPECRVTADGQTLSFPGYSETADLDLASLAILDLRTLWQTQHPATGSRAAVRIDHDRLWLSRRGPDVRWDALYHLPIHKRG